MKWVRLQELIRCHLGNWSELARLWEPISKSKAGHYTLYNWRTNDAFASSENDWHADTLSACLNFAIAEAKLMCLRNPIRNRYSLLRPQRLKPTKCRWSHNCTTTPRIQDAKSRTGHQINRLGVLHSLDQRTPCSNQIQNWRRISNGCHKFSRW